MSFCIEKGVRAEIVLDSKENSAVQIAAENLKNDLIRVFHVTAEIVGDRRDRNQGERAGQQNSADQQNSAGVKPAEAVKIILHTADGTSESEKLLPKRTEKSFCREGYALYVQENTLSITGADRRGTVYGIYDFCERIGVSPWHFWADVPDRETEKLELPEGYLFTDYPSVEYRGVFINDEEELEKWVKLHMGEDTIGVKTYEKIFELILRLKGNYIWPAMHVNSFNMKKENGALADRMGIVVGTSHCDMLMRSNNREWRPWIAKKGYTDVEYDYSIPGRNREILDEYWRESVEQNKDFEVSYTLGMRGIHDSGFETKTLKGLTGKELLDAKINLLETVIDTQERILGEVLEAGEKNDQLKTFVPYKEVLELYDNGLKVPEDLTLIWANDNYGHIRRYPGEKERKRKGGNGIYYHNSYWAPPGASYLFTKSIPVSQTKNELKKAWNEGIRKLWVLNIGALKPLEIEISFYLRYAWEIGKSAEYAERTGYLTQDVKECLAAFFDGMFTDVRTLRDIGSLESNPCGGSMENSGKEQTGRGRATTEDEEKDSQGEKIAKLYIRWAQLTNVRKVEQLDSDAFSQHAYGNEASDRMLELQKLKETADEIYEKLPGREKDAFFQIVLWRIHASYISNAMYYYADRSAYCNQNGMYQAAQVYAERSMYYDEMRRKLLYYYGNVQAEGKWSGIVTPEDFPPPRTAMYPAYVFPLKVGAPKLIVKAFGDEETLVLTDGNPKWLTLFNGGEGTLSCRIKAPEYVNVWTGEILGFESPKAAAESNSCCGQSMAAGELLNSESIVKVGPERRILVQVKEASSGMHKTGDRILITCDETGESFEVTLTVDLRYVKEQAAGIRLEADGIICCEAAEYKKDPDKIAESRIHEEKETDLPEGAQERGRCGWNRIPYLGRGYGDLMESFEQGKELSYRFFLMTAGRHLLELHRFPSLDSVGKIQIYVRVDNGESVLLKTEANDEKRGTWKENVRDGVDRLYLELPDLGEGEHTLTFISDSKYFAFSRWVIYTDERRENMMGMRSVNIKLYGENFAGEKFFYEDCPFLERPVIYSSFSANRDTLLDEDIYRYDNGSDGRQMQICRKDLRSGECVPILQDIIDRGKSLFVEEEGQVVIDAAAAFAETEFACTQNAKWDYCGGFSYGGRGMAMHIRKPGLTFGNDPGEAIPSLKYRFRVSGGEYVIWTLLKYNSYDHAALRITVDGEEIPKEKCNMNALRKYSAEQVYRWGALCRVELAQGEHELTLGIFHSDMRIDRICLVMGDRLACL